MPLAHIHKEGYEKRPVSENIDVEPAYTVVVSGDSKNGESMIDGLSFIFGTIAGVIMFTLVIALIK